MDTILLFGYDRHLLNSRAWLLVRVGHNVLIATNLNQLKLVRENVDLLILCHTLSPDDRMKAIALLSFRWPNAKRMQLGLHLLEEADDVDEGSFPTLEGPAKLLHGVDHLLHPIGHKSLQGRAVLTQSF